MMKKILKVPMQKDFSFRRKKMNLIQKSETWDESVMELSKVGFAQQEKVWIRFLLLVLNIGNKKTRPFSGSAGGLGPVLLFGNFSPYKIMDPQVFSFNFSVQD